MKDEIDVPGMYSMKMFKEYKKSSCLLECQAQELIEKYGCLPYYMPSLPRHFIKKFKPDFQNNQRSKSNSEIICSSSQLKQMAKDVVKMSALKPDTDELVHLVDGLSCPTCPDECETTKYSTQVSYADFEDTENFFYKALLRSGTPAIPTLNEGIFQEYEMYVNDIFSDKGKKISVKGPPLETKDARPHMKSCLEKTVRNKIAKMSYMHVYFKNFGLTKYSRNEVYAWQDLIGFFGGIVGLCIGFSLLSGAELIYFFSLRFFFWYRSEKNQVAQSLEKELENIEQQQFWEESFKTFEDMNKS